jgi:hypothetical protein
VSAGVRGDVHGHSIALLALLYALLYVRLLRSLPESRSTFLLAPLPQTVIALGVRQGLRSLSPWALARIFSSRARLINGAQDTRGSRNGAPSTRG